MGCKTKKLHISRLHLNYDNPRRGVLFARMLALLSAKIVLPYFTRLPFSSLRNATVTFEADMEFRGVGAKSDVEVLWS